MRFDTPPLEGRLLRRYKRFLADVELPSGEMIVAHCPNTGSLLGCKAEGSRVWLRDSGDPKRKLRYTWQAIEVDGTWVNVDTNLPNRVVSEAVQAGQVPELDGYGSLRREVKYGLSSRIDILLESDDRPPCYVEVKSTTLVDADQALFPDAVTERGLKHLDELGRMVEAGARAVQFFLVSRDDVGRFGPADGIDPAYGRELRRVADVGVELVAWTTQVEAGGIELGRSLPIELPPLPPGAAAAPERKMLRKKA